MSRSGKRHLKHKGICSHVFYLHNVWYYHGVSMVYPLWHDKFFTPASKQYSHPLKEHIQHGLYYIAMIKTISHICTFFKFTNSSRLDVLHNFGFHRTTSYKQYNLPGHGEPVVQSHVSKLLHIALSSVWTTSRQEMYSQAWAIWFFTSTFHPFN